MAKVIFSGLITSITGKLGGSILQNSYNGYQIRTGVQPRNPRSSFQQLSRADLSFIAASWRTLTSPQRATFAAASIPASSGFNLFVSANINLGLIDEPPIISYPASAAPDTFPLLITDASGPRFFIQSAGPVFIVPANTTLLLAATQNYSPSKTFIPYSAFNIFTAIPAGTDLSIDYNIRVPYTDRFKSFTLGKAISLRSALVSITNGSRSLNSIVSTQIVNP